MASVNPLIDPSVSPGGDIGVIPYPDKAESGSGGFHPLLPVPPEPTEYKGPIQYPDQPNAAHQAYQQTQDIDPDHAAKVLTASKALGENPAFVSNHLDEATKAMNAPTFEDFQKMEKEHPVTHAYVSDPQNMAVAKDDLSNITKNEQLVRDHTTGSMLSDFGDSLVAGMAKMDATAAGIPNLVTNAVKQIQSAGTDKNTYAFPGSDTAVKYWTDMAKSYHPAINDQSISDVLATKDIPLISKALTSHLIEQAPSLAMLLGFSAAGGGAAGIAEAGITTASDTFQRNRQMNLPPSDAMANALYHGAVSAAFMNLGTLSPIHAWESSIAPKIGVDAAHKVALDMVKTFAGSTLNMSGIMGAMTVGGRAIDCLLYTSDAA